MSLPSLGGLSLGPPTGPMAQYGKQILEPPSQESGGKRQRGDGGLAVQVFQWVPEEGDNPICPITQQPFVPGQWVYKTPANPPAKPTNYDPYALDQYWAHQTPVAGFLHDTLRKPIPIAEWLDPNTGLHAWVQAHPKPASPPATPVDLAQYVHKPPKNDDGTDFVQRPQPPPNDLDGMIFDETPAPPRPPVRYPGAGRLYGVPASIIAESDAPAVVRRYAAARDEDDWPLRYFNPTEGNGCVITHTPSAVVMTLQIAPNTPLFKRLNRLHGPVAYNPDLHVPGTDIDSLHIEDVLLRELCFNTDGEYPPEAARIYDDEYEWKGIRALFRSRDFKLDPFEWDFSGLKITLRVSPALMWAFRAPRIADLGMTRLKAIFQPWRNADGKIAFGEPGEAYRTFPADGPPGWVRAGEIAFRNISAKLISTVYNVISVVMHGDVADWELNGNTWRETERRLPFATPRPRRAPRAGFWVPRYENGAEWGGIPADMVSVTSEYVNTEYVPGQAHPWGWENGFRTCSFPIWYAVDERARGWLPSLGSDDFADRRTDEGVRAPVVWNVSKMLARHIHDFTPSGTPEMTLRSEGVPRWLAGFVETIATEFPWMDWRYFAPFAEAVSLEHEEHGLMRGLPPGTHQEIRGISRIAFTILGTSAVGKALLAANEFGGPLGGMSFRDFFLYTTFELELRGDVLDEVRNVARERPTLFGRAVHSSDFNVIVERLEDDWKITIEMSDAIDAMAWGLDPSVRSFPHEYPRTGGYSQYDHVYTPLHDHGVSTLTMPASAADWPAAREVHIHQVVRRAYARLIMGMTEAVSAILELPNRGSNRIPRLWSSMRMPHDVVDGGFLAAFPAEKWRERDGYTNSVLQREYLANEVMRANPPTDDGPRGRVDTGSFFFWYATAPVNEPAHYNVRDDRR